MFPKTDSRAWSILVLHSVIKLRGVWGLQPVPKSVSATYPQETNKRAKLKEDGRKGEDLFNVITLGKVAEKFRESLKPILE